MKQIIYQVNKVTEGNWDVIVECVGYYSNKKDAITKANEISNEKFTRVRIEELELL